MHPRRVARAEPRAARSLSERAARPRRSRCAQSRLTRGRKVAVREHDHRASRPRAAARPSGPGTPEGAATQVEAGAARRRDLAGVLRAYLSLTKPRIVELLLVTTLPTMVLAAGGIPDLGLVAVVLLGGSLAGGAASALELLHRPGHRPADAPYQAAGAAGAQHHPPCGADLRAGPGGAVARAHGGGDELARHGAHRGGDRLLRPRLHVVAQAPYAAEHVLGRDLRRGSRTHRMGRGDGFARSRLRGRFLPLFSFGRCRISTLWPSSTRTTMRGPAFRCCRWSPRRAASIAEILIFTVLTLVASLVAWPLGLGLIYGVVAIGSGALFLIEACAWWGGRGAASRSSRCACSTGRSRT